jgi:hypothetical protein
VLAPLEPEPLLPLPELEPLLPLPEPEPLPLAPPDEASEAPPLDMPEPLPVGEPELDPPDDPELLPDAASLEMSLGPEGPGVDEHPAKPTVTNAENARQPGFVTPFMLSAS